MSAGNSDWPDVANYHRNENSGSQVTAMRPGGPGSTPVTVTFKSLRDDLANLRATAPPGIVDKSVVSLPDKSEQGQNIYAIRIGRNPARPILIAGCHHAREWISVEVPFLIAELLVQKYSSDANIQRIVDDSDIWIVPMINPDGHEHTVLVDRGWRKTFPTDASRDSVDPNRNYATSTWGATVGQFSTDPRQNTYRGPSAGYAKETIAIQNLINARKFKGTLDYHSFGRFVLFPWAGRVGPHPDAKQDELATDLKRVIDSKGTPYRKLQASGLYPLLNGLTPANGVVPGGMMDFVVENVPDAIAITVELDPASDDPRGFVLPESEIDTTFNLHRASILTFLNCVTTVRVPPPTRPMVLVSHVTTDLVVFQPECWQAFWAY